MCSSDLFPTVFWILFLCFSAARHSAARRFFPSWNAVLPLPRLFPCSVAVFRNPTRCPSSAAALPPRRFLSSLPAGFPPLYFFFFRTVLFGRRGRVLCPSPPPAGCPNPPLDYKAGVPFFSPRRPFLFGLRWLSPAPERIPAPSGSVPFHCLLFCPSIFNPFVICPGRFSPAFLRYFARIIPACRSPRGHGRKRSWIPTSVSSRNMAAGVTDADSHSAVLCLEYTHSTIFLV